MAPPRGSFSGRARAPQEYGAYVHGTYYPPNSWLPRGTTDYEVRVISPTPGRLANPSLSGWMTMAKVFPVGTKNNTIRETIISMFAKYLNQGTKSP